MLGEVVEDRYVIEAELGEGAMGRVYRARHVKLAHQVAIKAMHRELARVPSILERFAREAPPPPQPIAVDDSAAALARRYALVGRASSHGAPDPIWERYRRIRLFDAMATAESRRAAFAELAAIERALP